MPKSFTIEKSCYGLWISYDKDRKPLVTSGSEEQCEAQTHFFLKGLQEGWANYNKTAYSGLVGGKL